MFIAPDAHITQLYIMSIQPVNKAVEHLISSAPILEKKERKRNAYLIKNSKGERDGERRKK